MTAVCYEGRNYQLLMATLKANCDNCSSRQLILRQPTHRPFILIVSLICFHSLSELLFHYVIIHSLKCRCINVHFLVHPPRYIATANDVEQEETVLNIQFVKLDCSLLKSSLVHHCSDWQTKLTQLLNHMACNRLKELHASLQDNANRWGVK